MEINSRYCELSTYAASSGYNSSTASSSLNYIDVENLTAAVIDSQCELIVDKNNTSESSDIDLESKPIITTVIITITLVKREQVYI